MGTLDPKGATEPSDLASADTEAGDAAVAATITGQVRHEPPVTYERGDELAHFVVLDLLGEGGMGRVYSAYDPSLDRRVAIKLLLSDTQVPNATDGRRRLLREAQALAKLQHENVVVVHEVGEFNGQVFLAMEQVTGGTLQTWMRAETRDWRSIVAMFRKAGEGLAAAHRQHLIHRDFKPANVLVGDDGRVRVTDFGLVSSADTEPSRPPAIAAGRAPTSSPLSEPMTEHGSVVGTPGYVAPELYDGGRADERSDQFAFCVSLYEALYGDKPFEGDTAPAMLAALLQNRRRARPSDSNVPSWLAQVVDRGLAADPADRHPSMSALLSELARDPQARRRRIAGTVAALAGVAAVASGAAVYLTGGAAAADPCSGAGDRIQSVWNDARRDSLARAFAATRASYRQTSAERVRGMIDDYASDWAAMRVDACEANNVRGEQSDAVFDGRIACLDRRLAELDAHVTLMTENVDESLLEQAIGATEALAPLSLCADVRAAAAIVAVPEDAETRAAIDQLNRLLADAAAKNNAGRATLAEEASRAAVEHARRAAWPHGLARALALHGEVETSLDHYHQAEEAFIEALPLAARSRDDALVADLQILLVQLRGRQLSQPKGALAMRAQAMAAIARAGDRPADRARIHRAIGSIHDTAGSYDQALGYYQKAYELTVDAWGPEAIRTGAALNDVAVMHDLQGRREKARKLYERVLAIEEHNQGPDHPRVARALNNLGIVFVDRQPERAQELYDRALAIYRAAYGDEHSSVAITELNRGVALQEQKRFADAAAAYQHAADIWRNASGVGQHHRATALGNLGDLHEVQGRCEEALAYYEEARAALVAASGENHPDLAYPLLGLGSCRVALGRASDAIAPLERALALFRAQSVDATEIAMVELALSRALWNARRDRPRARALALSAKAAYATAGDDQSDDYRKLAAWLSSRGWN